MPDNEVTRGDLEAMRAEFTKELGNTKLEGPTGGKLRPDPIRVVNGIKIPFSTLLIAVSKILEKPR